jgi:hypothetical protein
MEILKRRIGENVAEKVYCELLDQRMHLQID